MDMYNNSKIATINNTDLVIQIVLSKTSWQRLAANSLMTL